MNKQQIREAIGSFMGLKKHPFMPFCWLDGERSCELPDYLHDLNAIALAEAKLMPEQISAMDSELYNITGRYFVWRATAAQRSEALLRTIGKWSEADPELAAVMKIGGV